METKILVVLFNNNDKTFAEHTFLDCDSFVAADHHKQLSLTLALTAVFKRARLVQTVISIS